MSGIARKIERSKMKQMLEDFKKEAKLSSAGLNSLLYPKGSPRHSMKDKFSRMLAIAMQKLKEVEDANNGKEAN